METLEFYNERQEVLDKTKNNEYLTIAGDFNARVRNHPTDQNIGSEGEPTLHHSGELLRNICVFNNLKIINTFYSHKDIQKYTEEARGTKSLIDYVIINDKLKACIKDTKVHRGCNIDTDHYFVENKFQIKYRHYHNKQ
jgi:exonuclease III